MLGPIELEYSAFAVDGRPDLGMIVYNPLLKSVSDQIRALAAEAPRELLDDVASSPAHAGAGASLSRPASASRSAWVFGGAMPRSRSSHSATYWNVT